MMPQPKESSDDFFLRLNEGTDSAADEVNQRFRKRLCSLVEKELGRRFAPREDADDAVQSALRSFFRGIEAGRFQIDHSGGLWRLLEKITRWKILKHVEYHDAGMRTPVRECNDPDLQKLAGREPTPSDAVETADLIDCVLRDLTEPDPTVFRMRLEGKTRAEIARETALTETTVRTKLDRIRLRLQRLLERDNDDT